MWINPGGNTTLFRKSRQRGRACGVVLALTVPRPMGRQTHSGTTFDEEYRYSATQNNGKMQSKKNYVSGEDVT